MLVHLCGAGGSYCSGERGKSIPKPTGISTCRHWPSRFTCQANRLYCGRAGRAAYTTRRRLTWRGSRACLLIRGRCFSCLSPPTAGAVIGAAAHPPAGDGPFGRLPTICKSPTWAGVGPDLYQQAGRAPRKFLDHVRSPDGSCRKPAAALRHPRQRESHHMMRYTTATRAAARPSALMWRRAFASERRLSLLPGQKFRANATSGPMRTAREQFHGRFGKVR